MQELDKELKKELKGKTENVVLALLMPPREHLVGELRGSMKVKGNLDTTRYINFSGLLSCNDYLTKTSLQGLGTDEQSLIDILMPRTNREIRILKDSYRQGKT